MVGRKLKTPHDDEDGFTHACSHPHLDGYVVLYDGEEAEFSTDNGRWVMFCVPHGGLGKETNQQRAKKAMKTPEAWCRGCKRVLSDRTAQMKMVKFERGPKKKTAEEREAEMRFWAKKAKNSKEKQALFREMFGVSPEAYWD